MLADGLGASTKGHPLVIQLCHVDHDAEVGDVGLEESLISDFDQGPFGLNPQSCHVVDLVDFPLGFLVHWGRDLGHLTLQFEED